MRLLFAAYFLETGLILVVMPWSSFWDRNLFIVALPAVERFLGSPYARGAVSVAGVLELAAAFGARHTPAPQEPKAGV